MSLRSLRSVAGGLLLGVALATSPARAVELEGLDAPERVTLEDRELRLNGVGLRKATRFLITASIYVAALYLETPSSSADAILASPQHKQIQLRYLYAIDQADMKRAWAYSFTQNCPDEDCAPFGESIAAFTAWVDGVEPGDTYTYRFLSDRVEIVRNDRPVGAVEGAAFSSLLLSTWIGRSPPTEELKQGLLGGS